MSEEKKVELPPMVNNPHLRVIVIDDQDNTISGTLGITKERIAELTNIMHNSISDGGSWTDSLSLCSKYAKHVNELAYMYFMIGSYSEILKQKHSLLENLANKLKKD